MLIGQTVNKIEKSASMNNNDFTSAALEIAEKKLTKSVPQGSILTAPRLGTGGDYVNLFLWDTAFCVHWAKYYTDRFPAGESLDNFYRVQRADGFISRETMPDGISRWNPVHPISFAPPLLAWAEWGLYQETRDLERLKRVYPALLHQHLFNSTTYRREDGLFFSDMLGSGMDDLPRWDEKEELSSDGGILFDNSITQEPQELADVTLAWLNTYPPHALSWNRQLGWCDTSCQMAFSALTLSRIADEIGNSVEAESLRKQHQEIAVAINELCWDEEKHFYFDRNGDHLLSRRHIGAFWALIAEVATPERAGYMAEALRDPELFNCPCGVPGIAVNDKEFMCKDAYWRGPVWAPVNYMVLCGLLCYGEKELAAEIAGKLYSAAEKIWRETGTIWENYDPLYPVKRQGHSQPDFCGWSALIPLTFPREFL